MTLGVWCPVSGFRTPDTGHLTPKGFAMPKQKSKRALRKRVRLTATGRLRRHHAYKSHLLTRKHPKRKRHLRKGTLVSHADERRLKRLLMA
ncbi:MAG TPA: 50S ribosomal protein L35 [Gemmatimonadales bacterium]|nr:50S ribosomal protein L35 [Gemmatimonadales bacterium]